MIISHRHRFIFFSMPKTGSESLRALFAPLQEEDVPDWRNRTPFYSHMPPAEAQAAFAAKGWDFARYARISCMRNPYPRLVSLYRMIADVDGIWKLRRRCGLSDPPFSRWLRSTSPQGRGGGGRAHQRWRRYGTWSAAQWSGGLITHQVQLEHLAHDLPPVLRALNLPIEASALPHVNARPAQDWRRWYDPATAALVARRYAADLENYPAFDAVFA